MSIADHLLHAVAWLSLRAMPPKEAYAVVLRAGAVLPQRRSVPAIRRAAARLRFGSCLSRAMTLAARAPGSEVVIGVSPPGAFSAHAWIELDGAPLDPNDPVGTEITRLRRADL